MDGVLLTGYHTDRALYRRAVTTTLGDFGVDYEGDPPPDLVAPDRVAGIRAACDELDIPASPAWACRERAATTLENESIVAGDRTTFPDVTALSSLTGEYDLAVVSNNRHGTARFVSDHFGLPVDVVRGRFPTLPEFDRLKPDPYLLEWTLDRLDAADALFVGDRYSDVEAAHRAGVDAALLSRDDHPPEGDLDPEYHIESLEALPDLLS